MLKILTRYILRARRSNKIEEKKQRTYIDHTFYNEMLENHRIEGFHCGSGAIVAYPTLMRAFLISLYTVGSSMVAEI